MDIIKEGKYNLRSLLLEVTGDRGREYEENVVKYLKKTTNFKKSTKEGGLKWDANLTNSKGTGKTEMKIDIRAAMGNVYIENVKDMYYDVSKEKVVTNWQPKVDVDQQFKDSVDAVMNDERSLPRIQAWYKYLQMKQPKDSDGKVIGSDGYTRWYWRKGGATTIGKDAGTPWLADAFRNKPKTFEADDGETYSLTKQMGSFKVDGEKLRGWWLAKGRHYMLIGDNKVTPTNKDLIGQIGDDDPCGLGLVKMTMPEVRIEMRFSISGGFGLNTKKGKGQFGNMKSFTKLVK